LDRLRNEYPETLKNGARPRARLGGGPYLANPLFCRILNDGLDHVFLVSEVVIEAARGYSRFPAYLIRCGSVEASAQKATSRCVDDFPAPLLQFCGL